MMVAVETAIILPILLGMVGLLVVLATGALAQMTVNSAASQAARAASLTWGQDNRLVSQAECQCFSKVASRSSKLWPVFRACWAAVHPIR